MNPSMAVDTCGQLRDYLVDLAKSGRTATYSQTATSVGLDMRRGADANAFVAMLKAISEAEHKEGRPLISAVCVLPGVKRPGQAFFDLARSLGLPGAAGDNREFHAAELARVHAHWSSSEA